MPLDDFPGRQQLIDAVDRAVALGDADALAHALSGALTGLIRDGIVQLPDCCHEPVEGHYARRELYRSPELGYTVIAMTWGPGQGTPLHDHHGMWGVEGVFAGEITVDQYELVARDGERFRFRPAGSIRGCVGSAGSIIPPTEYHAIRNASDRDNAVSLHIYQHPMTCCGIFLPEAGEADGWYRYQRKELVLDSAA